MFDENFTFGAPRSPSLDSNNTSMTREPSRSVSPCTAAAPVPSLQFSVTDLAAQFAGQRIERQAQMCYDSCEAYANNDDDAGWQLEPTENTDYTRSRSRAFSQRQSTPPQRQRRQASTLLLCSTSHHREIADLVARMVQSSDQCVVSSSEFTSSRQSDNEGSDSCEDAPKTQRRSSLAVQKRIDGRRYSEIKSNGAVSKSTRFRGSRGQYHKQTSDTS